MRIHVLSDLHLEFGPLALPEAAREPGFADIVLLAGDTDTRRRGPAWAAAAFPSTPVVMIGGNHEPYGDSLYANIAANRELARGLSSGRRDPVHFLEREGCVVKAGGEQARVLGCTLWTSFAPFGLQGSCLVMDQARRGINDFRRITVRDVVSSEEREFDPVDCARLHALSVRWLEKELARPFDGVTIVMTHHLPSFRSVPERFLRDPSTPAFASDLGELIRRHQPTLWVHGHTHDSFDYDIGGTRILCNPRGYVGHDVNAAFDPALVVEV